MNRFAVFDIDGTVARTSLYLASLHAMKRRDMLTPIDAQAIDDALSGWLHRDDDASFETYSYTCIKVYERILPSLTLNTYQSICDEVLDKFGHKIYRYTTRLIQDLKSKNYIIFAVSGSEHSLVEKFCKMHGFDDCIGNTYEHNGERFTGKVGTTFREKQIHIEALMEKHGCGINESIGVGDTQGDISMLDFVKTPIAFNPNQTLYTHAKEKGWKIVVERKNVIYELQKTDTTHILM